MPSTWSSSNSLRAMAPTQCCSLIPAHPGLWLGLPTTPFPWEVSLRLSLMVQECLIPGSFFCWRRSKFTAV